MKAVLTVQNALVVFIAVGLTTAVLLVTGLVSLPQRDSFRNSFDDGPPFSSVPEFPSANEADSEAMRELAAAFLEASEWSSGERASVEGWGLADVAALTRRGERIGVYADVRFERRLSLRGPLGFIRCGQNETWVSPLGEFEIGGLSIWLLDGESQPYNVIPLNRRGELPKLQDIESFVASPADCPGPLQQAPEFERLSYTFWMAVDAGVGDVVGTVSATDPNTGDVVSYAITSQDGTSRYAIDASTGEITVAEAVDRLTGWRDTLTIQANDSSGAITTVTVKIKVVDGFIVKYDTNADRVFDRSETVAAVQDYYDGIIDRSEAATIVNLYYTNLERDPERQKLTEAIPQWPPTEQPATGTVEPTATAPVEEVEKESVEQTGQDPEK